MLYVYTSVTPNAQNLFYYFNSITNFQNELADHLLWTFTPDNYRINNNTARLGVDGHFTKATTDTITYIIDKDDNYYRCYFVDSANFQSNCIDLNLHIDLWGSYIAKCTLSDINVLATSKQLLYARGILPKISANYGVPSYSSFITTTDPYVIFGVSFTTKNSAIFEGLNVSETAMFAVRASWLGSTMRDVLKIICNITAVDGYFNDASVTSAYILPYAFISELDKATEGTLITYQDGKSTTSTFPALKLYGQTKYVEYNLNITSYKLYDVYVGPRNNPLKITHDTYDYLKLLYTMKVTSTGLQLLLSQGDNQIDISEQISLPVLKTSNANALNDLTRILSGSFSIVSGGVRAYFGDYLGGVNAISSGLNTVINNEGTRRKIVGGGDASATYGEDFSGSIGEIIYYNSITPQDSIINYQGATYNAYIGGIGTLFAMPFINDDDPDFTYIKADLAVNDIPTDPRDYIYNKFLTGIHIVSI